MLSQEQLREIGWEVGQRYPIPYSVDYLALLMVHPRLAHVHWHVREEWAEQQRTADAGAFYHAALVIRIYDVSEIIFDGFNAHGFFDLQVGHLTGNYYFDINRPARNYLAEIGLRRGDGAFQPLARSQPTYFDRERAAGHYQTGGLFVGGALNRTFSVENIFDAPLYEQMNRELTAIRQPEALSVVMLLLDFGHTSENPLSRSFKKLGQHFADLGGDVRLLTSVLETTDGDSDERLLKRLDVWANTTYQQIKTAHRKKPLNLIHCHDWYSSGVAMRAAKELNLPWVLTLHSTEHERTHGNLSHPLSTTICAREKASVVAADLVIVPHSSTRQQVINVYAVAPEKVVIIPDLPSQTSTAEMPNPGDVKRWFDLNRDAPLVLFAGEISHASGADLLVDALPTVSQAHPSAQFVLAGEGPLKGELEARAAHAGIGQRCRFAGDITSETFTHLLMACDFVAIPARTWQDESLAQLAIDAGRPVLTTHQAGIHCVVHGKNGLVTYDNPGSIVWGIQELLANPLQGNMLHLVAKKRANEIPSLQTIVVQHYMHYGIVVKHLRETHHG